MSAAAQSLIHPFDAGLLDPPGAGCGFFLRAEAPDGEWVRALACEQTFKPGCEALRRAGFRVGNELGQDGGFDVGLCLLSKHKIENFANIARGWSLLRPGGLLVCAGANDTGAGSVAREVKAALGEIDSLSKYHCKVFWFRRTEGPVPEKLEAWERAGRLQRVEAIGGWSRPGLYNWNKVDPGSRLLADHLPAGLGGRVADLGAGWGYLGMEVLRRCPNVASLDLFEAEWLALEAARANLGEGPQAALRRFHWHDVAGGMPVAAFDWVVMNPPFHSGKATDLDLGRAFIASSAQTLVRGGRLMVVANRHLPYEAVLDAHFARHKRVAENGLYKVIEAQR